MKAAIVAVALLFAAVGAKAQTTYVSHSAFTCDMASHYPVISFYQFSCRGIKLANSEGTVLGNFYWFSNENVEVFVPGLTHEPDNFESYITKVVSFTEPRTGDPGTFQFEWQQLDANNVLHRGTASGTWEDRVICGGRGCQWHAPKLLTFSTTAD